MPRYRQKLAVPPLETGRPLWVDDPNFNLAYHVRHTALPAPGDEDALLALAARVFSQRLDRSKPLWELWLVEGLDDGGFALLSKTHHAVVDGVSGVDLASVLFDLSPEGPAPVDGAEPWVPQPEPSSAELAARGLTGAVRAVAEVATGALGAVSHPGEALDKAREVGRRHRRGRAGPRSTPRPTRRSTSPPGPHRRIQVVRARARRVKLVKNAFGATVNDVVLAVVTGALAYFLQSRGRRTEGIELKAAVPVSVRSDDQRGALGNQLTQIMAPLPVFLDDPLARLQLRQGRDGRAEGVAPGAGGVGDRLAAGLRAADDPRPGLAAELLRALLQPARHQRARARSSRSTCSAASCRRSSRSRSWPASARWRSRSSPTTARSASGCSATTTRCPTSTSSRRASRRRWPSSWRSPKPPDEPVCFRTAFLRIVVRIRTYIATLAMLLMLAPGTASAAVQTREDPSDAPGGPSGKADLRSVAWDVSGDLGEAHRGPRREHVRARRAR